MYLRNVMIEKGINHIVTIDRGEWKIKHTKKVNWETGRKMNNSFINQTRLN